MPACKDVYACACVPVQLWYALKVFIICLPNKVYFLDFSQPFKMLLTFDNALFLFIYLHVYFVCNFRKSTHFTKLWHLFKRYRTSLKQCTALSFMKIFTVTFICFFKRTKFTNENTLSSSNLFCLLLFVVATVTHQFSFSAMKLKHYLLMVEQLLI